MTKSSLPLNHAPKGSRLVVLELPDGRSGAQLLRLGVIKGQVIRCLERLPGGTVVIQKHRQEIAIGVGLAAHIMVAIAGMEAPGTEV